MKKNLFFDVGSTLHYPVTGNWFITPNFFNIIGQIDLDIVLDSIEKNFHFLDEREINTEVEEYDMFCKFYYNVLTTMNYTNIKQEHIKALAYDCVYNDNKIKFYDEVENELKKLSKEYDLYIISDAWPSTYRILKNYGLYDLFKNVFISSDLGYKKSDKTLFEIALENIDTNDENYFIDDRIDLLNISSEYNFIPILIDRENNQETNYIKIRNLTDLHKILNIYKKTYN